VVTLIGSLGRVGETYLAEVGKLLQTFFTAQD